MIDLEGKEGLVVIPYKDLIASNLSHVKNVPTGYRCWDDPCTLTFNILCPIKTLTLTNGI